eukprot:756768-Hanusia_phi.AAC.2
MKTARGGGGRREEEEEWGEVTRHEAQRRPWLSRASPPSSALAGHRPTSARVRLARPSRSWSSSAQASQHPPTAARLTRPQLESASWEVPQDEEEPEV